MLFFRRKVTCLYPSCRSTEGTWRASSSGETRCFPPPPAQDVTCQEEVNHSYEEQEAATQAEPGGEHDVNVEDMDEVLAVKGQVEEGLAEESEVEEKSQVERITEMEDGGQLGGSEAYTINGWGTQGA